MNQKIMARKTFPDSAKWTTVGEVCEVLTGFAFKSAHFTRKNGVPLLRIRDLKTNSPDWNYDGKYDEKYLVHSGDLLIGMDGEFIPYLWAGPKALLNQRVAKLIFKDEITKRFAYYFIGSALKDIEKKTPYTTVKHISPKQIRQIKFPLLSLEAQQKIVSKLDAQMAQIGLLNREVINERELSNQVKMSFLSKMFDSISDNCEIKSISEICHKPQYGYTASSTIERIGPKLLRITDIQNGLVDWENVPYCLCSDEDYKKFELKDRDIVFVRTGATTGKSFIVSNPKNTVFASYLIRLKIFDKNVLPEFLYLFFQSQKYWEKIVADSRGGIMPNFNAEMLAKLKIPIPSKDVQERFIKKSEILSYNITNIEQNVLLKFEAVSKLGPSILREVFQKDDRKAGETSA